VEDICSTQPVLRERKAREIHLIDHTIIGGYFIISFWYI